MSLKNFNWVDDANSFLVTIFEELKKECVEIKPHWQIDHLCYRVDSESSYLSYKDYFLNRGELLVEGLVSGRLISTFKLKNAIQFEGWTIDVIELPAPKKGSNYKNGFEHFEVVFDLSFSELRTYLRDKKVETKGLDKNFNPEFELKLKNGAIKFHHQSLESVVTLEKSKIYNDLENSKVMEEFKAYEPVIVGTFPLAIDTDSSDIDVVIHVENLKEFVSTRNDFKIGKIDSEEFALCNRKHNNLEIEIFAQERSSVSQNGYKHFNLEDRLLKLGKDKFRDKIIKLRKQGLKTEDSFCQALGIKTENPYLELLKYYYLSEDELKRLIDGTANT